MIRRERLAVCATLPLARTLSRFDAGFTVPVWRDARLDFDEAAFDTLTPVELTVTRIMLTPCPDRSRHSLLPRGSIRRPSKTPALTLPSDQMGYGGSLDVLTLLLASGGIDLRSFTGPPIAMEPGTWLHMGKIADMDRTSTKWWGRLEQGRSRSRVLRNRVLDSREL